MNTSLKNKRGKRNWTGKGTELQKQEREKRERQEREEELAKKQREREKREAEKAADTLGFNLDLTDLDYALCALDVATEVDPFDDKMAEAIKTKCPDLSETHKKYVAAGKKK